jgi:hypothetical protein
MIAIIIVAILIFGGIGYAWMNNRPAPPADYKPIMPPSGYAGQASGMSAQIKGGSSYPGGANRGGYPGSSGQGGGYPGQGAGYPGR